MVEPAEAPVPCALGTLRALADSPSPASVESAILTATEVGRRLAEAAEPDPDGVAAIQLLRARIETLCGEPLASLSSEAVILLARSRSTAELGEHLLVEALLCAARSHRAADRLDVARLRASEALAVAQVGIGTSNPVTAACWTELGKTCEAAGDLTAARAAYREACDSAEDRE